MLFEEKDCRGEFVLKSFNLVEMPEIKKHIRKSLLIVLVLRQIFVCF